MYYVYILSNWNNEVIYTGFTSDIQKRIYQHKNKLAEGFTKKYNVDKLVYYEAMEDRTTALEREKQIKRWRREKKNFIIEKQNPDWNDLYKTLFE